MSKLFETNRCIIRPFLKKDMDSFMEYRNNLEWMQYQGFKGLTKEEYIERLIKPFNIYDHSQVAIVLKETGIIIGDLYVKKCDEQVHVGYTINPKYSRQGLAFEATSGLIAYIKYNYPSTQIKSGVDVDNTPSIKLLEKLGFQRVSEIDGDYEYILKRN